VPPPIEFKFACKWLYSFAGVFFGGGRVAATPPQQDMQGIMTGTNNANSALPAGTALQLRAEGVDHPLTSRVIGWRQEWLVVEYSDAMTAFDHLIRPGIKITVRFQLQGAYHQFASGLRQILQTPKRVLVLDQPGPLENIERRALPRHDCDLPSRMEVRRLIDGRIININTKGCRLRYAWDSQHPVAFHKGDAVKLRIKIPERHTAFIVAGEIRGLNVLPDAVEAGILFGHTPQGLLTYLDSLTHLWRLGHGFDSGVRLDPALYRRKPGRPPDATFARLGRELDTQHLY
jgi:hypothetical protein